MSREAIYTALFSLVSLGEGQAGRPAVPSLQFTSRRVRMWDSLPAQPALCQAEHGEEVRQVTGQEPRIWLDASWMIFLDDARDPTVVPATLANTILDQLQALFPTQPELTQTLGGLVHYARIDGKIIKIQGDIDGQGLLVVPIRILVP